MASDFLMCACSSDMCLSGDNLLVKSGSSETSLLLLSGIVWASRMDDVRWAFLVHHGLMKSDVCF